MNTAKSSSDRTTTEDSVHSNILTRFRRLRIEENLLTKNISKTVTDFNEENQQPLDSNGSENERVKSYLDIRNLFEEVKVNTISRDNLKSIDIGEVKKDILDLESKIQNSKASLQKHLQSLKLTEMDLIKQMNENPNKANELIRPIKVQVKPFSEVVPSPVKSIINSPFKCPEVQEMQNFLAISKNRYGGWVPYNHDLFKTIWQKYFKTQINIEDFDYQEVNVESSKHFPHFLQEVLEKIQGVTINDIITHNKWYSKYVYLKERQHRALETWKSRKHLIKTSQIKSKCHGEQKEFSVHTRSKNYENGLNTSASLSDEKDPTKMKRLATKKEDAEFQNLLDETLSNDNILFEQTTLSGPFVDPDFEKDKCKSTRSLLNYRNPTVQWYNRCNSEEKELNQGTFSIENIHRRRIPDWRQVVLQTE